MIRRCTGTPSVSTRRNTTVSSPCSENRVSNARSVFLKAHFFGQPFKVLKVDKTLVDYYTKLSDFHAQFRAVGTNYNQVVKELRLHFSEKKAMALLYKLEQHTVELVKLSRRIVELSREMEAKWSQKSV